MKKINKNIIIWIIIIIINILAITFLFNYIFLFSFFIIMSIILSYIYGRKTLFNGIVQTFLFLISFTIILYIIQFLSSRYSLAIINSIFDLNPPDIYDILTLFGFGSLDLYAMVSSIIFSTIFYFINKKFKF